MRTIRTKELSEIVSKSFHEKYPPEDVGIILEIIADTISAALSRGYEVQINRLGIFKQNSRKWIRFYPGRTMRERYNKLKDKHCE